MQNGQCFLSKENDARQSSRPTHVRTCGGNLCIGIDVTTLDNMLHLIIALSLLSTIIRSRVLVKCSSTDPHDELATACPGMCGKPWWPRILSQGQKNLAQSVICRLDVGKEKGESVGIGRVAGMGGRVKLTKKTHFVLAICLIVLLQQASSG